MLITLVVLRDEKRYIIRSAFVNKCKIAEAIFLVHCMLCYRLRLSFLRDALESASADLNAVTLAKATGRHCGELTGVS